MFGPSSNCNYNRLEWFKVFGAFKTMIHFAKPLVQLIQSLEKFFYLNYWFVKCVFIHVWVEFILYLHSFGQCVIF